MASGVGWAKWVPFFTWSLMALAIAGWACPASAAVAGRAPAPAGCTADAQARTARAAAQCCSRCGTRSVARSSGKNSRAPSTVTTRVVPGMVSRSQ
jgi:hypothetical protein